MVEEYLARIQLGASVHFVNETILIIQIIEL